MSTKTFQDLIEDVHKKGICQLCGGCVSFCNSAEYNVIGFNEKNAPPEYLNKDECLECGICYYICPQTNILEDDINKTYKFSSFTSMPIGYYDNLLSCQATDQDFLNYGTDGGVVNSIINYLIQKKLIDGAIVAKTKAPFSREASFAKNKDDLINASGLILEIAPQLEEIQRYNSISQSLPKLNHYKFKKLAVVGTPCQIYTIRCMQNLGVVPSENIEICLGLFCYENFSFDIETKRKFEEDFNIRFEDITKINIKEDVIFELKDGGIKKRTVHIPFDSLNNYMRTACNACNDFTNIYADISFGGLGSPNKFTTVITRTKKGRDIISGALESGIIKRLDFDNTKKDKLITLLSLFSQSKVKRKELFLKKNLESRKITSFIPKLKVENEY